jgi:two-component system sensor histidine kinase ChiS
MEERSHILVVEDEPLSLDMLSRRLEQADYRVTPLRDGAAAIAWLSTHRCDIVLMDVAMPRMNGIEALKKIRETFSHDSLPVILVSAMVDSDDVVAGLSAGANDYVVKPVNFRVLQARIHACLRMRETVRLLVEAERQRVMIETLSESAAKLAQPLAQTINNLERVMQKTIDDRETQDELNAVVTCVDEVIQVIEKLKAVGETADLTYDKRLEMLQDGEEDPV